MNAPQQTSNVELASDFSSFATLPTEMLVEIFNHLKSFKKMEIRAVCRSWEFVIGQVYPLNLWICDDNWRTLLKTKARLLNVIIDDFNYRIDAIPSHADFCFRIRKLELSGVTLYSNFLLVLKNCLSLEKLTVDIMKLNAQRMPTRSSNSASIFDLLDKDQEELQRWLPSLKKLQFRTIDEEEESVGLLRFLCALGRNKKLTMVWITIPTTIGSFNFFPWYGNSEPSNFIFADLVGDLLTSNQSTLSTVIVERQPGTITNNHGAYELQKCLGLWTYPHSASELKPLVKNIEGMDIFFEPNGQLRCPWDQIFQQSKYAKIIRLAFQDDAAILPQIQNLVTKMVSPSLTQVTLQLRVVDPNGPIFSLAIFSRCSNLKTLELWHHQLRNSTDVYVSGSFHHLTGIETLPASLKTFRTSFTILSTCGNLHEMPFANFGKVETLELITTPWFIFNDAPLKVLGTRHLRHLKRTIPKLKTLHVRMELFHSAQPDGVWKTDFNVSRRLKKLFDSRQTKYYASKAYYCSTIDVSKLRNVI